MYDVTLPVLRHQLNALSAVLKKAEAYCAARKIEPEVMTSMRLFPDMLPLTRQVLIACDFAKGCAARLSGQPVPSYTDDEKTFEELEARIQKTLAFMGTVSPAQLERAETREVTIKVGGKDRTLSGQDYYYSYVLPNFYFHVTTAYNILRHNGVELGKGDFLGRS